MQGYLHCWIGECTTSGIGGGGAEVLGLPGGISAAWLGRFGISRMGGAAGDEMPKITGSI